MCTRTSVLRRAAILLGAVSLSVTLAACSDDSGSENAASDTRTAANGDVFNDADVSFATDMIPHHAQAVQMVDLAEGRPLDPEVEQLAEQIRAAQVPEIETMTGWLMDWDEEVPETQLDPGHADHDMDEGMSGMEDMPGAMSAEDMEALKKASDAKFQDMWLQMMVEHHQSAVEMSAMEQEDGAFPEAIDLAETIETSQNEEIATMEELLG